MVLEKPGESDLLGKLKQHQLEQKDRDYLRQRSRPTTGRSSPASEPGGAD
jgi:hypothetical protein